MPFLHVRREHPEALKIYANLYKKTYQKIIYLIYKFIQNILKLIFNIMKSLIKNSELWYTNKNIEKIDILFVSHLVSNLKIGSDNDFYFENIPNICEEMGFKVGLTLIDHINIANTKNSKLYSKNREVIILPRLLNFKSEIKIGLSALKLLTNIIIKIKKNSPDKDFYVFTLINSISPETIATLRLQFQFKEVLKQIQPKLILLTWEGHGWERLLVSLGKTSKISKSTVIGYQFSALSRLQYSALRSLGDNYDPHYILTTGRIGFKRLINFPQKITSNVYMIGKKKPFSSGVNIKKNQSNINILVIPEGIIDECKILFAFCEACANLSPEINFTIRLHPSLNFDQLKLSGDNKDGKKNIIYSKNTLEEDIGDCSHVLYRGSSAVINALENGLRPIYLSLENELSIDPIFELKYWKLIITSPNQLIQCVSTRNNGSALEKELAIQYGKLYFQSQSIKKVRSILKILANSK
jgi:hypothetical protein